MWKRLKRIYRSFRKTLVDFDPEQIILLEMVQQVLRDRPKARILDVGCGYGRNLWLFHRHGYDATGVDSNPLIVEANRKHGLNCFTVEEFRDVTGTFELVLMSHVIEHFSPGDLKEFMDSWLDPLADDGYLIIATPLLTEYFYDDFDHVKPYHPTGILMVFGTDRAQVQYYSRNRLTLEDIRFRRSYFRLPHARGNFIRTRNRRLLQAFELLSAGIFFLSRGTLGKKDGWIGLFRKSAS